MPSWQKPTAAQVSAALRLSARAEEERYFFSRLSNPLWIDALSDAGHLVSPAPIEDESGTRYPHWPISSYIAKVSGDHPDHAALARILRDLLDTENVSIQQDMLRAMAKLDPNVLADLLPSVVGWLSTPWRLSWLIDELGDLVVNALEDRQNREGVQGILEALLQPRWREESELLGRRASSALSEWEAEQFALRVVPRLSTENLLLLLQVVVGTLDALLTEMRPEAPEVAGLRDDHSIIWYPRLGTSELLHDAEDILVFLGVDVLDALSKSQARPDEVLARLTVSRWMIVERMTLRFLASSLESRGYSDKVHSRLTRADLASAYQTRREFDLLLATAFSHGTAAQQSEVLQTLHEAAATRAEEQERWLYGRLARIADHLQGEWRELFERFVRQFGEATSDEPLTFVHWSGVVSPLSDDSAKSMSAAELAEYARRWDGSDEVRRIATPSWSGLAADIREEASGRPDEFSDVIAAFSELNPTILRAVLEGLKAAVERGHPIEWAPVLQVVQELARRGDDEGIRPADGWDRDISWSAAKMSALDLLELGLARDDDGAPPTNRRSDIWDVLVTLAGTSPPAEYATDQVRDSVFIAVNAIPSRAIYVVVLYLLWLRRSGTEVVPDEAKELIERVLDPEAESFVGMRAAVAHRLPQLTYLDGEWARSILPRVFTPPESAREHWEAAWTAFLKYASPLPNSPVREALDVYYQRAVDDISPDYAPSDHYGDPVTRLGEHLLFHYLNGYWAIDHPTLVAFFHQTPTSVRSRVLDWMGRGALQESPVEEWLLRAQTFFEWRERDISERDGDSTELRSIGLLVAAEGIPPSWWRSRLAVTLDRTRQATKYYIPLEEMMNRVAAAAPEAPQMALDVLELVVEQSEWGWHSPYLAAAETILERAVEAPDLEGKARTVADRLARAGHDQFERFLRQEGSAV